MSDHINAVYNNMYLVITTCAGKMVPKGPNNRRNINMKQSRGLNKVFQEDINYLGIYLFAFDVKEQVCLDALLVSLSSKNHCVAPGSLAATQVFPGRDPM